MARKWKQWLKHPVALTGQGFVFGVILFWATAPGEASAQVSAASAASAAISANR